MPRSSQLAFGCGSIMGRIGKRQSIYALNQALDAGITHFDVARSYGYGEAEACVGSVLKRCRDKVVIATKFGIQPSKSSLLLRNFKPLAQRTIKAFPFVRQLFIKSAQIANVPAIRQPFLVCDAKISVEKSLAELNTNYIDILFLHECSAADVTDEILYFLQSLVKEGKIRAYGVATSIDSIVTIQKKQDARFVLQFSNGLMCYNDDKIALHNTPVITHSPFLKSQDLFSIIKKKKHQLQACELHLLTESDVYELMLCYAIYANKNGVIISSMLSDQHLSTNVRIFDQPRFTAEQIAIFVEIVKSSVDGIYA